MAQVHNGIVSVTEFIEQLDTTHEVKIPSMGYIVHVQTHSSLYEYDVDTQQMRGGVLGERWIDGSISGTTFGGSMIKVGYLIPGSYMEFVAKRPQDNGEWKRWTSSPIQKVVLLEKGVQ